MSTGKEWGLPEQYADWVLVDGYATPVTERVRVIVDHYAPHSYMSDALNETGREIWFVPPKPKPKLPDVGVGGVVRFHTTDAAPTSFKNRQCRAIRRFDGSWDVHTSGGLVGSGGTPGARLLEIVDDAGFFVELKGI